VLLRRPTRVGLPRLSGRRQGVAVLSSRRRAPVVAAALAALLLGVAGCGGDAPAPPTTSPAALAPPAPLAPAAPDPGLPDRLVGQVSGDGAFAHLQALQQIADRNGGTRESGTPGFDQSVDYVADQLRRAGYRVDTPSFTFDTFSARAQTLAVAGAPGPAVTALTYSPPTPPGGLTAPLVVLPQDPTPGCDAADYAGLPVAGAVVLARRGVCPFTQKGQVAQAAGAAALLVANNEDGPLQGTLASVAEARLPAAGLSRADGDALTARAGTPVTLVLDTTSVSRPTRNVIAQTSTGRPDEVVMSGAHLDSVAAGPGINDNGSGSAAQLDLALRLGSAPPVANAVRFAWWGAEEYGLLGSTDYVRKLTPDQRRDIALVLNSDMLGSPNPAYFAYDGDDSDRVGAPPGPNGSAGIERLLLARLAAVGVQGSGTDFDGRSDYGPFIESGIPAGGLFTGAEEVKTPEQAARWGGQAGVPYDRCYHQACDTLANVDRVALDRMTDVVAYAVGRYAVDLGGPDGVPPRAQRTTR
jgi:Zn-dependent M28 family amino/carboxypeptidase